MTNRLFMSNNTGDVQFITNPSRWSLGKTRQELKCLLVLCAFPVIWLHDGDVLDGIKPRVLVLRQESTQSNSWGWSAGGWVQVSGELGRRNNSTAAKTECILNSYCVCPQSAPFLFFVYKVRLTDYIEMGPICIQSCWSPKNDRLNCKLQSKLSVTTNDCHLQSCLEPFTSNSIGRYMKHHSVVPTLAWPCVLCFY